MAGQLSCITCTKKEKLHRFRCLTLNKKMKCPAAFWTLPVDFSAQQVSKAGNVHNHNDCHCQSASQFVISFVQFSE